MFLYLRIQLSFERSIFSISSSQKVQLLVPSQSELKFSSVTSSASDSSSFGLNVFSLERGGSISIKFSSLTSSVSLSFSTSVGSFSLSDSPVFYYVTWTYKLLPSQSSYVIPYQLIVHVVAGGISNYSH